MSDWNVGDEIIVQEESYGRGSGRVLPYTVTRVARKYFYADASDGTWPRDVAFEINGGREKNNGTNYHSHAYAPWQWEAKQRREATDVRLREHRVDFGSSSAFGYGGHRLTEPELEGILAILDQAAQRIASNAVRP